MSNEEKIYQEAFNTIGHDASPNDAAPDEYGCAESVSKVIQRALPELRFPTLLSTRMLYEQLCNSPSFRLIEEPIEGAIIISPTGSGHFKNGHTGIVGKHAGPDGSLWIMSNDSRTGSWEVNYTVNSWRRYFETKGGMAVLFFDCA